MSAVITPTTAKATRKMFSLLEDNFDPATGQYLEGYSDQRIAKECEISLEAVKNHRVAAFGKLAPPTDLAIIKREIDELQRFALQTENDMRAKIKDLNHRILQIQKRFD
jgi:hypothetical protein